MSPDGVSPGGESPGDGRGRYRFDFHRATPRGEGGIAIFELSGEGARGALEAFFRPSGGRLPGAGEVRLGDLVDPSGESIDEIVVSSVVGDGLWQEEQLWSVSVHGGVWIQERLEEILLSLGGRRRSLRDLLQDAIARGKLDAPRAAAYELLLQSRTEKAARFFLRQYQGELTGRLKEGLDLLERGSTEAARRLLVKLQDASTSALRLGHPLCMLITGRPNAGKSTLFNTLMDEQRAIVTPGPGTTRDLLEGWTSLSGYPLRITDSAGVRPTGALGPIEREGIRRVRPQGFDAVLHCVPYPWARTREDDALLSSIPRERVLTVASLADLAPPGAPSPGCLRISAVSGEGLDALRQEILLRWIDPRETSDGEVLCAPFTPALVHLLGRAVESERRDLDVLRSALVESLHSIWPGEEESCG